MNKIYSEKEIATEFSVSPWTVRLWRLQAGLPHFRTAGRIFYRLDSVLRWMDSQEYKNMEKISGSNIEQSIKRIAQ